MLAGELGTGRYTVVAGRWTLEGVNRRWVVVHGVDVVG